MLSTTCRQCGPCFFFCSSPPSRQNTTPTHDDQNKRSPNHKNQHNDNTDNTTTGTHKPATQTQAKPSNAWTHLAADMKQNIKEHATQHNKTLLQHTTTKTDYKPNHKDEHNDSTGSTTTEPNRPKQQRKRKQSQTLPTPYTAQSSTTTHATLSSFSLPLCDYRDIEFLNHQA